VDAVNTVSYGARIESGLCNVTLYNVDDFIRTQIDTQIGYVQSDVYEFSTTVRSILP